MVTVTHVVSVFNASAAHTQVRVMKIMIKQTLGKSAVMKLHSSDLFIHSWGNKAIKGKSKMLILEDFGSKYRETSLRSQGESYFKIHKTCPPADE